MMTKSAQRLLDMIVRKISEGRFVPGNPKSYLGYKEIHDIMHLPRKGGTWGRSLQRQGLNDLADWLQRDHVPAITGLIVDTTKQHTPGHGYFTAFNNDIVDYNWWREEMRRAIAYDWSSISDSEELPTHQELQDFEALFSEGQSSKIRVRTRRRCEALIRRAKSIFMSSDGELECAACGWRRPSVDLKGDIIEIHHCLMISSYPSKGIKWTLAEALKHLIPLCPNCHRIAHAKPNGVYSLDELNKIVK